MTVKQLQKYRGKVVTVTWLDSGAGFTDTDLPPDKLDLTITDTMGLIAYVGPMAKRPDIDIAVIITEQPTHNDDKDGSYEATVIWLDAILKVKK